MRTIALIPARAGSRGIPNKNLRLLGGKPLLAWTVDVAKEAKVFDLIVVSAGSEEIHVAARRARANAFLRPAELGTDTAPMIGVVEHAIKYLGLKDEDIVVLLQPTGPFRSVESIRDCVQGLEDDKEAQCCMTIVRVPDRYHPNQIIWDDGSHSFPVNRQELKPLYVRAGTVYAFYAGNVSRCGDIYGELCTHTEVPESEALNLDEMSDWHEAERRVKAS